MRTRSVLSQLVALAAAFGLGLSACSAGGGSPDPGSGLDDLDTDISVDRFAHLVQETEAPALPVAMSLAEAQAQLPFAFGLPEWVPDGFSLTGEVDAVLPASPGGYAAVIVTWQNAAEAEVNLQAAAGSAGQPQLQGTGEVEQVAVNGQPATLARRGAGLGPGGERLALSWTQGPVRYTLSAESDLVPLPDLIRMAESIRS